jgi:hypothetical protein
MHGGQVSIFMNGWMGAWGSGFDLIWGWRDFEGARGVALDG